jgi:hypothetical protein
MDHDDIIAAVSRLEAVADRFDKTVDLVADHAKRIASLEQSRSSWRAVGKVAGGAVASLIVGVLLFFLVGRK